MNSPNPSHITYSSEKVIWTIVAKNNGSTPYNSDVKVALSWNHPVNYLRVSSDTDGMQGVQFGDGSAVGTVFNRTTSVWNVGPLSVGQEKRLYVETSFDELQNLDNLLPLILTKTLTLDSGNIPNNVNVVSNDVLRKGVIPFPSEIDCSKVRYGPPGPPGPSGLDNYTLAVQNGFVGDIDAWILSLQGATGPVGPAGQGLAAGGTMGQVLYKTNGTDYMTHWGNPLYDYYLASIGTFDPLNPLVGWTQPPLVDASNAVVQFTDGTIAYYSCNGVVWSLSFKDDVIKRVANYTALRALDNYFHNTVVVDDFSYTGPDGNPYTTLGGIFRKVTAGVENYSTIIVATNGDIWERDWDRIHLQPEWFEIGGTTVMFGTTRPIYNESDRLRYATGIIAATPGTVLMLYPNKTYLSDADNYLSPKMTVIGNNATIKRADTATVLLTANVTIGQTVMTVDDASSLRTGLTIILATGDAVNQNQSLGSITNISVNTITFSDAATINMNTGSKVIRVNNLFAANASDYMGEQVIRQVTFDGNIVNNSHTFDWKYNNTLRSAGANGGFVNLYDCVFLNTPSENVSICKGIVSNCVGNNLGGSFVHIGNANAANLGSVTVKNCYVDGVVMVDPSKNGHGYAFIEFSLNPINTFIEDCRVINSTYGKVLNGFADGKHVKIKNSYFGGLKTGIETFNYAALAIEEGDIFFENNVFESCGDLSFQGNDVQKGFSFNKISLKNNIFVNTRVSFREVSQVYIENNKFLYEDGLFGFSGWTSALTSYKSMLSFLFFDQIKISNNDIIGPIETDMNYCFNGISLINEDDTYVRLDASDVATKFSYAQNIDVLNNHIAWFVKGIVSNGYEYDRACIRQVVGWKYHGNTVYMTKAASNPIYCMGIHAQAGVDCRSNVVYYGNNLSTNFGIVAQGINNSTDAETLLGAIVCGNTVLAAPINQSILVGSINGALTNQYNNVVKDNIVSAGIQNVSGSNSYIADNVVLNTTNLPGYITPPTTVITYGWKENAVSY